MKGTLESAMEALDEGRFQEALETLEELVNSGDADPEVLIYLGIAYVQTEQPAKAIEVLREVVEEVEDHCVPCLFLGRALKALGRLSEAEGYLRRAVSLDPGTHEPWEDLGNILFSQKEYGPAAEVLREATKRYPENASMRGLYAICFHRLGDYTGAEKEWAAVMKMRPDSIMATANYAYILTILGRYIEARPIIEQLGKLDATDYRYLMLKGELLFQSNKLEEAKHELESVLDNGFSRIQVITRLAVIEHRLGNKEKSDCYLKLSAEAIDEHPQCWRGLNFTYQEIGMENRVVDTLLHGTQADKGSAAPWIALAKEYRRLGQRDEETHAWTMSFRLRGYIKLQCHNCEQEIRVPYDNGMTIDFDQTSTCESCMTPLSLMQSLSFM
ncbi:MAG: tetratricopeptide repeat protein [Candidatus Thorarchaeota archaeon]